MINVINKYKVSILWILSIMIFIVGVIVAQFRPFSDKGSGVLMWFTFNSALLAMIFSAMNEKNKYKIMFCIVGMVYITYTVFLGFV